MERRRSEGIDILPEKDRGGRRLVLLPPLEGMWSQG